MLLAGFRAWRTLRRLETALAELEDRVERLEGLTAEGRLRILDTLEKVSQRLAWRERKRDGDQGSEPSATSALPAHLRHLDPVSQRIWLARLRAGVVPKEETG